MKKRRVCEPVRAWAIIYQDGTIRLSSITLSKANCIIDHQMLGNHNTIVSRVEIRPVKRKRDKKDQRISTVERETIDLGKPSERDTDEK